MPGSQAKLMRQAVQCLDYAEGHLSVTSEDPASGNWQAVQAVSM